MRKGLIYEYNGNKYRIVKAFGLQLKFTNEWEEAISYEPFPNKDGSRYVRSKRDFLNKFKRVN